jgi:hypothetical protein
MLDLIGRAQKQFSPRDSNLSIHALYEALETTYGLGDQL